MVDIATLNPRWRGTLPDHLGMIHEVVEPGYVTGRFTVEPRHMAANGYLHAASIIALVDSACGVGSVTALPEGATGFTTIEIKTNYLGSTRDGTVTCEARMVHGGRNTQVWDATASHAESGKVLALFRCTQMILYPR
ncbi:MAG TPA: PaaI family thioesterase [Rhizomicrobium sp.]|jgi:uncharacterized protein (TIGR00369 family)